MISYLYPLGTIFFEFSKLEVCRVNKSICRPMGWGKQFKVMWLIAFSKFRRWFKGLSPFLVFLPSLLVGGLELAFHGRSQATRGEIVSRNLQAHENLGNNCKPSFWNELAWIPLALSFYVEVASFLQSEEWCLYNS